MKRIWRTFFCVAIACLLCTTVLAENTVFHDIRIIINPDAHSIEVEDRITLPEVLRSQESLDFYLHESLSVTSSDVELIPSVPAVLANEQRVAAGGVPLAHYTVKRKVDNPSFTLRYHGDIFHPIKASAEETIRSFSDTPGIVSSDGAFLSSSSAWYPQIDDQLISFRVNVVVPLTWSVVSQGVRTQDVSEPDKRVIRWQEKQPQDDIYLVAGPFTEYSQSAGVAQAMVFLLQPDQPLAQKYLDATAQYIAMYRQLIGPYPYAKFALVENYWQSGFGMPSFTLLGSQIIRFPFILHSSFPHEILHNWWGNSVYADYQKGNWAEGLTTYLADHLIKEQRHQGMAYRRDVLQKYTDFVNAGRDFALTEFRSRHSSSSEAVGYGKTMMFFHMLRTHMGDDAFKRSLHTFYRKFQFRKADFDDLQAVFSEVSGIDLSQLFEQWVKRVGAPILQIQQVKATVQQDHYVLTARLEQIQSQAPYQLKIPIAIHLQGSDQAVQKMLSMDARQLDFTVRLDKPPIHLDIDPEFDLFRRLDRSEIPPALSQGFGAEQVLMVLPSRADPALLAAYKQLASQWQTALSGQVSIIDDSKLEALPGDKTVWVLGWKNHYRTVFADAAQSHQVSMTSQQADFADKQFSSTAHAVILSARHPVNPSHGFFWLASNNKNAMAGLARKLPHYRKYSYLAFEGDEPTNIAKGQWPVLQSPLSLPVPIDGQSMPISMKAALAPRSALAQLPAAFSEKRMLSDIEYLASQDRQGRGLGTPELDDAADYIANEFKKAGLQPVPDNEGSYLQVWNEPIADLKRTLILKNVIGMIPGSNPKYAGQSVIVSAHYDHLGHGWPDVHAGDQGKIHPGADDNASGVAVLLELARTLGAHWQPERTVIFTAFTGEEASRLGSIHYVKHSRTYPTDKIFAVVNMDTVGRIGEQGHTVFGTGSATQWVHIMRGIGFVTGLKIKSVAEDFSSGDQRSFIEQGIPAVHVFGTVHEDFHRPSDTIDKIIPSSLVKTATLLKEALDYLAGREDPLTITLANVVQPSPTAKPPSGRKVSVGTVPDFAYQGKGVRITGTTTGSPAQAMGLQAGDILVEFDNQVIMDLSDYAKILRASAAGKLVSLHFLRDGKRHMVRFNVIAR